MRYLLVLLVLLLVVPTVLAEEKTAEITLLAVSESATGFRGNLAELTLRIEDGKGRVFIESNPLTKVDTQISTRFAKQVICEQFNGDCNRYDFFFTISARSAIVGGPSAGAAAAILVLAVLEGEEVNQSISLTGTINSGGLIGPVGGIVSKIEAAVTSDDLTLVLIPAGEQFVDQEGVIIDALEYGEELGIEVREVADIFEAAELILGKAYPRSEEELEIDPVYAETMAELARDICARTEDLFGKVENPSAQGGNLSVRANEAAEEGSRYSQASFCFGANIQYTFGNMLEQNYTNEEIEVLIRNGQRATQRFERSVGTYDTITELQSYSVVQERLDETKERLNRSRALLNEESITQALFELAFASERLYSARAWSNFLNEEGDEQFSRDILENSCRIKLSEAEERFQYVTLFYPEQTLRGTREDLNGAYQELENENFELCLFKASKAKAEANTVQSVLGVRNARINDTLDRKLQASKESILAQTEKGLFPIVGYSYYEYAQSLRDTDVFSAMLFAEYSLELSNLDVYFEDPIIVEEDEPAVEVKSENSPFSASQLIFFVLGILLGAAAMLGARRKKPKKGRIIVRKRREEKTLGGHRSTLLGKKR